MAGNALPRHQLQAARAMRDVGLTVGDLLGLGAGRRAEDDHAGAEAIAGVVEERARADQKALGLKVVNELVVELRQFLPAERKLGRRVDDLVVDHPALLTLAHDILLRGPVQANGPPKILDHKRAQKQPAAPAGCYPGEEGAGWGGWFSRPTIG
jgi:hypothetical protein